MNKEKSVKIKRVLSAIIISAGMISSCKPAESSVDIAEIPTPITSTALPPSCPTTEEAKQLFGVDVQKIETEPCGWVWRGSPESHSAVCPKEYVCTWDVKNDVTVVHHGINQRANIFAGTWRLPSAYSKEDSIHDICELYRKEKDFGANEIPTFEVRFQPVPGVGPQTCPEK